MKTFFFIEQRITQALITLGLASKLSIKDYNMRELIFDEFLRALSFLKKRFAIKQK